MSRLHTNGFETQERLYELPSGASVSGAGTVAIDTSTVHLINSKGGAASMKGSGGQAELRTGGTAAFTGAKERDTFYRFYVRIDKAPEATRTILQVDGTGAERIVNVRVGTTGTITFTNGAGAEISPGGELTGAFTFATWHLVELKVWVHTEASKSHFAFRLDGKTLYESETFTLGNFIPIGYRCGWMTAESGAVINVDDIAINDNQGTNETSWPGEGVVKILKPTADKSVTGFTAGAGGTTELFKALNHSPPTGVVVGSATNTSQIKDATNNATDNVEETLESYETAGLTAAGTLKLAYTIAVGANSSTTSRTLAAAMASNPEIAETTLASGTTAGATFPTGWKLILSAVTYAPTVTLGTGPVVKLRKGTASTDSAMYSLAGLMIEMLPKEEAVATQQPRMIV